MEEQVFLSLLDSGKHMSGGCKEKNHLGWIEVLAFEFPGSKAPTTGSAIVTGDRQYSRISFKKRIDSATPLIAKALSQNAVVEGTFEIWRPTGMNRTEHYFTVNFTDGRIDSMNRGFDMTLGSDPVAEWIGILYKTIKWSHAPGKESETYVWEVL